MKTNNLKVDDKQVFDEVYDPEFLWGVLRMLFYEAAFNDDWADFINKLSSMLQHETYKELATNYLNSETYKKFKGELNG